MSKSRKITTKYKVLMILPFILIFVYIINFIGIRVDSNDEPIRIIYIPKVIDADNDFWTALIGGTRMAAREYDIDLTVVAPETEDDYVRQNELIAWAIDQKPDAIALSPANYNKTTPMAEKIVDNDIKLVLIDSAIDKELGDISVATDNYKAGNKMGRYMQDFIKEDTVIGVVSHVQNTSTAIERLAGVESGLESEKDRIIDVVYCDSEYGKAYNVTKDLLERHPDINMIVGLNEYSSVGATRAVIDLNLEDEIEMFGIDASMEQIQFLEAGILEGIIIQKSFNMGYLGIEEAAKLINEEKISNKIDSGSQLITDENIYTMENQKLLFPFVR